MVLGFIHRQHLNELSGTIETGHVWDKGFVELNDG